MCHHRWCSQIIYLTHTGLRIYVNWQLDYFVLRVQTSGRKPWLGFYFLFSSAFPLLQSNIFRYLEFTEDYAWSTNEDFIWAFWGDYTAIWVGAHQNKRIKESKGCWRNTEKSCERWFFFLAIRGKLTVTIIFINLNHVICVGCNPGCCCW